MKKLAFVAAAALAGSLFADGIASANVVGYMSQPSDPSGNYYRVPTFGKPGTVTKVKLSQIVPDSDWDSIVFGDWLGTVQLNGEEDQTFGWDGEKWYKMSDSSDASDVEINLNQGIIIYAASGATLTYSGEVVKGDTELFTDPSGNAYTGNFVPVKITLGDIVPDGDWSSDVYGDWLGTIAIGGAEDAVYTYDGSDWYDAKGAIANAVPIQPGQGLIIYAGSGAKVSIVGAID